VCGGFKEVRGGGGAPYFRDCSSVP
jgi:hypothetical protein